MADLIENCRRHRVMIGLLTVLGALLLGARAQQEEFRLVGSDVTLVPKYTGELEEITWILNDRIFVEIVLKPQEKITYPLTNNRATINKTNGALTIRNLTIEDSGLYKAEARGNSTEYTEIRLTVRGCPDQPTISVESTEDQFVVSCKSVSPDVTYEWFNQTRSVSKSRSYTEDKKHGTLTCVVDNKVCNKSSSINFYIPAQPEVKTVGDDVTLVPQYTGDPSEIIWKVNGYKLVKMMLKPQVDKNFYRLKGRATISETDGSLTLRGLTMEDSGDYTAVVLVNNDYYYTDRRLPALKSSPLSGGVITGIVIGVLTLIFLINIIFLLWYYYYKESRDLSGGDIALKVVIWILSPFAFISIIFILWYYFYKNKKCRKKPSTQPEMTTFDPQGSNIGGAEELERCITMKFRNDYTSPSDESRGLLEDRLLTIHGVVAVDDLKFTAEAVIFDKKKGDVTENKEKESDPKIHVKELVWKENGVTLFKWANSSLKFHASNIKLEPGSVTVYNAEGKESYIVFFQLEEHPVRKSICCITFHPIKMTGKDQITWKKDSQPVNTRDKRITCDPNGDLTIKKPTSKDKGKYTVQCIDNKLDQEFILHL